MKVIQGLLCKETLILYSESQSEYFINLWGNYVKAGMIIYIMLLYVFNKEPKKKPIKKKYAAIWINKGCFRGLLGQPDNELQ